MRHPDMRMASVLKHSFGIVHLRWASYGQLEPHT